MLKHKFFSIVLVVVLMVGMPLLAQEEKEDTNPRSLIGEKVLEVKLPLVGGGEFDLSKHKGKDYVVLDFWATWCPWCVKSTAHFVERSEQYKDKNVAFYMVSVGEKMETVKKYMEKKGLKVNMAVDTDWKLSEYFKVDYIPHVAIIDKEGTIIAVDVGEDKIGPVMDEVLKKAFPDVKQIAEEKE